MGASRLKRLGWTAALALLASCAATPSRQAGPALPAPPNIALMPTAAAPPPLPRPAPSQCGVEELAGLVGRPTTEIPVPVHPESRRVVCSTCPRTEDFSPTRQTIVFDATTGLVVSAACG